MVVAVKAKGFSLFPGIAGKCSPPMAGSLASGVVEGSGMPSAEQESTLQNPGSAGRAVEMEWWLTSLIPLVLHWAFLEHPLYAGHSARLWATERNKKTHMQHSE